MVLWYDKGHNSKLIFLLFLLWQWVGGSYVSHAQIVNYGIENGKANAPGALTDTVDIYSLAEKTKPLSDRNPDSAIVIYEMILQASNQLNYTRGKMISANELALIYGSKGNEEKSVDYFYFAIHAAENAKTGYPLELGRMYNNLAGTFNRMGQTARALEYLDKSVKLADRTHNYKLKCATLINIGNVFLQQKKFDQAGIYFSEALQLSRLYKLATKECITLLSQSDLYLSQSRPADALNSLGQIKSIRGEIDDMPAMIDHMNFLTGKAYYQLKDFKSAEQYLITCLNGQSVDYTRIIGARGMLATLYAETHQYEKAFRNQQMYGALKDSLQNINVIKHMNHLEAEYQSVKKDKELAQQKLRNDRETAKVRKKNFWIWSISMCSVMLAVLSALLFSAFRRRKRLQEKEIQLIQQQQKIEHLNAVVAIEEKERNRIGRDLHDSIGGMVAAINMNLKTAIKRNKEGITDMEDFEAVAVLLQSTAKEIRETAHNLMPEILNEHSLQDALHIYCNQINGAGELKVELYCHDVPEQLENILKVNIFRILQELMQNIIKHANATKATIQLRQLDGTLSINVEDNGSGFSTMNYRGVGLKNIESRTDVLGGYMSIDSSTQSGTTIYLEFDLENYNIKPIP